MADIENQKDIKKVLTLFYSNIEFDTSNVGHIFREHFKEKGSMVKHIEHISHFWMMQLFAVAPPVGFSPFMKHTGMAIPTEGFETWIEYFHNAIDALYQGEVADRMKVIGKNIANAFASKFESFGLFKD